jgi:ABC-2 type transport system permease protein
VTALQHYVPTIAAVSVLGSCYSQLAIVLSLRRQNGSSGGSGRRRYRRGAHFPGFLAHCVVVSVVDVALIVAVGRLYGVPLPTHLLARAVTLVLGAASLCALGVALASLIRKAEAAPSVVQLVLFPLGSCPAPTCRSIPTC